jgi:hypothetical protein
MSTAAADTINATAVNVIENLRGDVNQIFQLVARPVGDFVRVFDLDAADDFVGRQAVFDQLDAFVGQYRAGYFEIVGAAGLGKTALASEIARRHDAVAFLASAGNTHRPDQFLEHVSAALIVRYGLGYATLPVRAGDDVTFLGQILRESVERAGGSIWVVVDALDEADPPPAGANPLLLPTRLPAGVYMVVTRRTGQLVTSPSTPVQRYTLRWNDPLQTADLVAFVRARVAGDRRIVEALASGNPPVSPEAFVARLVEAGEGNFMYASYVLADVAERGPEAPPLDLGDLPPSLQGWYEQFWERMSAPQTQDWEAWAGLYQPVLERLAVAREAVTADWLGAQVDRPAGEVRSRVLEPWSRVLSRGRRDDWRLVHRTFGEYLEGRLDLQEADRTVAEFYVGQRWGQFDQWDAYGLRHTATHLAAAADRTAGQQRHDLIAQLARLVTERGFQQAHLAALRDPTLLRRDLELAHRLAAKDDHQDATFLLVPVALTQVLFHRQVLRPEAMFDAARDGDVQHAERLLDLFSGEIDADWHNTILLTMAWLAAANAPGEAARLRDQVRDTQSGSATVARLLDLLTMTLDGVSAALAPLPPAPTPQEATAMVARIAGSMDSHSMLAGFDREQHRRARRARAVEPYPMDYPTRVDYPMDYPTRAGFDPEEHGGELRGEGVYLSALDGPPLVALAAEHPDVGDQLLGRYLEAHRAYGYPQYRNGSLWELLTAVLLHPAPGWVREWLARIGLVVLAAPNRGEFLEGLEIAVLALQANAGDGAAAEALAARRDAAVSQAAALPPSPIRGQGDVWGVHRRRLASLAEAYRQFPAGDADPADLAARALAVGPGFAGITAPACLTVAEAASVAVPGDTLLAERALAAAERTAHKIQDFTFCARTTARVAAMRERWWPVPPLDPAQVAAVIGRLSRDRSTAEFSALHVVGERYRHREERTRQMMPPQMLTADTLEELATVYQRPIEEFLRHNQERGWAMDERLPAGTRVNVPDPGFPPLVAARLSAAILAGGPPGPALSAQLRHLVPVTGADVTALGTVLARLLLSSPTQDIQLLAELRGLVSRAASAIPSGEANVNPRLPS